MGFASNDERERLERSGVAGAEHQRRYIARHIEKLRAQGWHWEADIAEHNLRLRESRQGDYEGTVRRTLERLRGL